MKFIKGHTVYALIILLLIAGFSGGYGCEGKKPNLEDDPSWYKKNKIQNSLIVKVIEDVSTRRTEAHGIMVYSGNLEAFMLGHITNTGQKKIRNIKIKAISNELEQDNFFDLGPFEPGEKKDFREYLGAVQGEVSSSGFSVSYLDGGTVSITELEFADE
jgi:hypothetical protein